MGAIGDFILRPGRLQCFTTLLIGLPLAIWLLSGPVEGFGFWILAGWGLWHGLRFVTADFQKRNATYKKVLEDYEPGE